MQLFTAKMARVNPRCSIPSEIFSKRPIRVFGERQTGSRRQETGATTCRQSAPTENRRAKDTIEFEHGLFTWDLAEDSSRKSGPWDAIISATNKSKGFLDYRALLRIHFLPGKDGARIDVFDLVLRQLLPHYTYYHADYWKEAGRRSVRKWRASLAQGWSDVERRAYEWHGSKRWPAFKAAQKAFDEAIKQQVEIQLAKRHRKLPSVSTRSWRSVLTLSLQSTLRRRKRITPAYLCVSAVQR